MWAIDRGHLRQVVHLKIFQPAHLRETVDKTLIITVKMLCDSMHIIGNRYHFTVCNPNAQDTGQNHNITILLSLTSICLATLAKLLSYLKQHRVNIAIIRGSTYIC